MTLLGHWMQATDRLHEEWLGAEKRTGFASTQMVLSAMNASEYFTDTYRMLEELAERAEGSRGNA